MLRQLFQEYHFVKADGPGSEARWRQSLTPYHRGVRERTLADEAEERARPLPSDLEPVDWAHPRLNADRPERASEPSFHSWHGSCTKHRFEPAIVPVRREPLGAAARTSLRRHP